MRPNSFVLADGIAAIPFTAWEQAVFVVLLMVLVGGMLGWMSRENAASRRFQQAEAIRRDTAVTLRDKDWQAFLGEQSGRDEQQRLETRKTVAAQTVAITELAKEMRVLCVKFDIHVQNDQKGS